mgnify:CR=1 FL=1
MNKLLSTLKENPEISLEQSIKANITPYQRESRGEVFDYLNVVNSPFRVPDRVEREPIDILAV